MASSNAGLKGRWRLPRGDGVESLMQELKETVFYIIKQLHTVDGSSKEKEEFGLVGPDEKREAGWLEAGVW